MPDDPLPPGDGDDKTPKTLICEFCECKISRAGEVIKLGAKAKAFRDSDGAIEKLTDRVAALDAEITTLKSDLEAARAAKPADVAKPGGKGLSFD
jgi:uncharacterized small protein (DUF1192 family)